MPFPAVQGCQEVQGLHAPDLFAECRRTLQILAAISFSSLRSTYFCTGLTYLDPKVIYGVGCDSQAYAYAWKGRRKPSSQGGPIQAPVGLRLYSHNLQWKDAEWSSQI